MSYRNQSIDLLCKSVMKDLIQFWKVWVGTRSVITLHFLPLSGRVKNRTLRKIPRFHLISYCGNCASPQNFHTRKLGEILVFYTVKTKTLSGCNVIEQNIFNIFQHIFGQFQRKRKKTMKMNLRTRKRLEVSLSATLKQMRARKKKRAYLTIALTKYLQVKNDFFLLFLIHFVN